MNKALMEAVSNRVPARTLKEVLLKTAEVIPDLDIEDTVPQPFRSADTSEENDKNIPTPVEVKVNVDKEKEEPSEEKEGVKEIQINIKLASEYPDSLLKGCIQYMEK